MLPSWQSLDTERALKREFQRVSDEDCSLRCLNREGIWDFAVCSVLILCDVCSVEECVKIL